jgi:hypothetical protein
MPESVTEDRLTDLVILGRAAPEEMSDGRQSACTGAWSPTRGFIRLYPIDPRANLFSRWDVINVDVERNPKDARHESWKIKGRKSYQDEKVEVTGKFPRRQRATLLHNLEDECVRVINNAKRSLGIVRPETIHALKPEPWDENDEPHVQAKLFTDNDDFQVDNREDFEYNLKLKYTCPKCQLKQGFHNHTLLEWGAYMGLKNNPGNPDQLRRNYKFDDDEYNHWFFVGNLNRFKNSFIVISVIWLKNDVPIEHTLTEYPKVAPDFEPLGS